MQFVTFANTSAAQALFSAPGLSWGVRAVSSPGSGPCSIEWPELGVAVEFACSPVPDGGFAARVQQRELGCDRRPCMRGCAWGPGPLKRFLRGCMSPSRHA